MIHISRYVILVFDKILCNIVVLQYTKKNIFIEFSQKVCIFTRKHFGAQFFLIFTVFLMWHFKLIMGPKLCLGRKFMSLLLGHLHLFQRWQKRISRDLKSIPKKPPYTGEKKTNQTKKITKKLQKNPRHWIYHNYTAVAIGAEL